MTYGFEAVIPLETGLLTMRNDQFDNSKNEQLLSDNLDLAEKQREVAPLGWHPTNRNLGKDMRRVSRQRPLC